MNGPWKVASLDTAALLVRWFLGGLFIYMGLSKALLHDPVDFLKLVRQYEIVSSPVLLNAIAAALPWFEVFCGLLLVAGVAVRGSALVLVCLLVPFTALILRQGLALAATGHLAFCAVKFNCGCGNGEVLVCHKLPENCLLILFSAWLVFRARSPLCARFSLLNRT